MLRRSERLLLVLLAAVAATQAVASEPLQDANVAFVSLKVNAKGEALFTYRRADGRLRHVLAWGAINARAPSQECRRCGSAGTTPAAGASTATAGTGGASRTAAARTTAPRSSMLVAACKAPDGTYWTVQAWQRRLPLLGFDPGFPLSRTGSSTSRTSPASCLSSRSSRTGRTAVAGRACSAATRTSASRCSGSARTAKGVPKDKYGRNLYIDTLQLAVRTGLAPRVQGS